MSWSFIEVGALVVVVVVPLTVLVVVIPGVVNDMGVAGVLARLDVPPVEEGILVDRLGGSGSVVEGGGRNVGAFVRSFVRLGEVGSRCGRGCFDYVLTVILILRARVLLRSRS